MSQAMIEQTIRYSLIGGSVVGFIICVFCYIAWRREHEKITGQEVGPTEEAATLGKLSAFNAFIMVFTGSYFVIRYIIIKDDFTTLAGDLLQLMVLGVYVLIIVGLCLPGLVSYIAIRARRREKSEKR